METSATGYKSISRVGEILFCLSEGINTVTEIANRLRLSKSTASRLLKALEESSLVVQDPADHRYYLGSFITQIYSNPTAAHMELVQQASEEMKRLSEITQETVFLGVMVGIQYIRLNEIVSKQELRICAERCDLNGTQYVGAVAKVLLAQLEDGALELAIKSLRSGRVRLNPTDGEDIVAQLMRIREQGYSISHGERVAGIVSMAAPISNYAFPAALGILAPEVRLQPSPERVVDRLIESARRISSTLRNNLESRRLQLPENVGSTRASVTE